MSKRIEIANSVMPNKSNLKVSSSSTKSMNETFMELVKFCQPESAKIILGFSALIINAVTNLSFPTILGQAVDQSMQQSAEHSYLIRTACIFAIGSVASFVRVYCLGSATDSIASRLRKRLFSSYIKKNMDFFDENRKGQLLTILNQDVHLVSEVMTEKLASGLRSFNSSFNGSILLFGISPYLFTISIGIVPFMGITIMKLSKYGKELLLKLRNLEGTLTSFTLERLNSITTIRLYGREEYEVASYECQLNEYYNLSLSHTISRSTLMSWINFTTNLSLIVILYAGGKLIKENKLSAGALTKFALQSAFVGLGFSGLSVFFEEMRSGLSAASRIFDVINEIDDCNLSTCFSELSYLVKDSRATHNQLDITSNQSSIEFANVSFSYTSRKLPIFQNISSHIASKGGITAVAGRSGSGKSTAMALITGLYHPSSGKVLVGGRDVSKLDLGSIREQIGVVEQTVGLLSGTIASNIAYGKDGATQDDIICAAKLAEAHEFISALPDGYNTQIGENASMLSGGQKARIALARALVRNPMYLLLDEVTSALDRASEIDLINTLQKLGDVKTVVVFTHSDRILKVAKTILLLKDGMIVANGTYNEIKDTIAFEELYGK